jgi:Predicted membrane protein
MTAVSFSAGSLMFSYYIPKIVKNVDVRKIYGSDGNPGSSNAILAAGIPIGLFCMALDVLKAFVPVYAAVCLFGIKDLYLVPVMVAPVLGHAFSPLMSFNGGKAISVAYGSLLAVFSMSRFVLALALIMAFFRFIIAIHPDSSSVIVSMLAAIADVLLYEPLFSVKLAVIAIGTIVVFKTLRNPNAGAQSVSIWHYSLSFEEKSLKIRKI